MCWIAVQNSTDPIPDSVLRAAFSNNKDGAGLVWSVGDRLDIRKPLWLLEDILSTYHEALNDPARAGPLVMHFRLSTGGNIDANNTHPHITARGEVAVAHNGILPVAPTSKCSDTVVWIQTVLHRRSREQIMDIRFLRHQEQWIGHNKIVILDRFGNVRILRSDLGIQKGEDWFSAPFPVERPKISVFEGYPYKGAFTDNGKKIIYPKTGSSCPDTLCSDVDWVRRMENLAAYEEYQKETEFDKESTGGI